MKYVKVHQNLIFLPFTSTRWIFFQKTIQNVKPIAMSFFTNFHNNMCWLKQKKNTKKFPWSVEDNALKTIIKKKGVSYCGLSIYIKMYLKAKEELWKFKYFTMQKYNLQKIF
jgi:hypothetical protein